MTTRIFRDWLLGALAFLAALASALPASAQPAPAATPVVRPGDAVVTGFAGTRPPGADLPADVHPLDRTEIDPEGVTVRIFDLSQLGGGPEGQLTDPPVRRTFKAKEVGHVFAVAFDGDGSNGPPSLYLAASSVHGLQLMAPGPGGRPERVMTGRPGAEWMKGLFSELPGAGPGSVFRIDGRTGAVSLFATIRTGDEENSGAGLGALAFDPRSRHLYVSDLETGLVWRLDVTGRIIDAFDHGTEGRNAASLPLVAYDPQTRTDRTAETFNTEVPETWGFAPPERRVSGLAVEGSRLYYATADGPLVWSVGLNADGSFGGDARVEIDVKGTPAGSQIGSILFDGPGVMYLAQRGTLAGSYDYQTFMRPQEAAALRYQWLEAERRWAAMPQEYAVGMAPDHHGVVGGLALNYGYDRFGRIDYDRCRQTLWLTGEHLRAGSDIHRVARGGPRPVGGLQGIYKSRVRPDNEPPFEAWYVDYDAAYAEEEHYGHIGNVAIYGPCRAGVTYSAERVEIPVWTRGPNLVVEKRCDPAPFGGRVACHISVRNTGDAVAEGVIDILDDTRVLHGPAKGSPLAVAASSPDGSEWSCGPTPAGAFACKLPAGLLAPGALRTITVFIDTLDLVLAGGAGFRNCVTIDHPHGKGRACAEGGTGLTVAKTGPLVCEPGEDCKFTLTLTNASPAPFKGPVLLSDHLLVDGKPVEAPISKIEPPLACQNEPIGVPFACVADVGLAPGASLTHEITLEMPGPGPKHAQNCFIAAEPGLAAKPGLLAGLIAPLKIKGLAGLGIGAHPACVWIKLDDPKKVVLPATSISTPPLAGSFTPTHGLPPLVFVCASGLPPLPGGRCPCPLSAPWDPATGTCRWRPVCWDKARLTPDGGCCPKGTVWWASSGYCRIPPVVGCPDPWRRRPDGGCCPGGQRWRDGACRPPIVAEPCGPGFTRLLSGQCLPLPVIPPIVVLPKCPDGRPRLANGRCPAIVCPLNAPFNPATGRCETVRSEGCQPGYHRIGHGGRCVPVRGACPGVLVRDAAGRCVPLGLLGKAPLPPTKGPGTVPPTACPPPLVKGPNGLCIPRGLVGGGLGQPCPVGEVRIGDKCVPRPKDGKAKGDPRPGPAVIVPPGKAQPPKEAPRPPVVIKPPLKSAQPPPQPQPKPSVIIKPPVKEPQRPRVREAPPKPVVRPPAQQKLQQQTPPRKEPVRRTPQAQERAKGPTGGPPRTLGPR